MSPLCGKLPVLTLAIAASILLFAQACTIPDAAPAHLDDGTARSSDLGSDGTSTQPGSSGHAFVPPETAAGNVLASAMAEARATDRLLFVHSGADW